MTHSTQVQSIERAKTDLIAAAAKLEDILAGCPSGNPELDLSQVLSHMAWAQMAIGVVTSERARDRAARQARIAAA